MSQADPFRMERAEWALEQPWRNAPAAFMTEKKLGLLANFPARMVHSKTCSKLQHYNSCRIQGLAYSC